jgi:hypothetical protein
MPRTIALSVHNELDIASAKQRISDRFAVLKAAYIDKNGTAVMKWDGDTAQVNATALGQNAKAAIAVTTDRITIDIKLPLLLAGMGGMIESILTSNADALKA